MKKNGIRFLLLASLTSVVMGCSSLGGSSSSNLGDTHFYSLVALAPTNPAINNKLRVGIGPVEIPRLLNRPQIVSRKNNTEILMAEKHQWGGSYKEELVQALTDNFSNLLNTENIEKFPWKLSFKPNYHVKINIERFDGELGKSVTLKARWRLYKDNKEIAVNRSLITVSVPAKNNSYGAYVNAQSFALSQLSKKIITKIK